MRAAMFRAPGSIVVQDAALPIPTAGQARIKVAFCGVWGDAAVGSARLVAAADPSANRLREFAARWQVDATYDAVGNSVVCEFDIVGSLGRIRIGNTLCPELYTLDPDCTMALTKRAFPASVVAKSPMTVAVEELIRALETGEPPASDLTDARSDLELAVAFHLADRTGRVVSLPITELDYSITDLWGRYA